jgi:hypothetical protein
VWRPHVTRDQSWYEFDARVHYTRDARWLAGSQLTASWALLFSAIVPPSLGPLSSFLLAIMAHPSRRVPSPNPPRYYAVPQSPQNYPYGQGQQRRTSRSNRARSANGHTAMAPMPPRNDLAQGVATGAIGAGYGPYAVLPLPPLQCGYFASLNYFITKA